MAHYGGLQQQDDAGPGEMGYGENFGDPLEDFRDTSLPAFRTHSPTAGYTILTVALVSLSLITVMGLLALGDDASGSLALILILSVLGLVNLLALVHCFFLISMKTLDQPRGKLLYQLELASEERIGLRPLPTAGPAAFFLVLLFLLLVVTINDFESGFCSLLLVAIVTIVLALNLSRPRHYIFTDQGFGVHMGGRRPALFFWPWTSFRGFSREGELIRLRPRRHSPFQGFALEAGEKGWQLGALLEDIFAGGFMDLPDFREEDRMYRRTGDLAYDQLPQFRQGSFLKRMTLIAATGLLPTGFFLWVSALILSVPDLYVQWQIFFSLLFLLLLAFTLFLWLRIYSLARMGTSYQLCGILQLQLVGRGGLGNRGLRLPLLLSTAFLLLGLLLLVNTLIAAGSGTLLPVLLFILFSVNLLGAALYGVHRLCKTKHYIFTDQGFGQFTEERKPRLLFWSWSSFRSFQLVGDHVRLLPGTWSPALDLWTETGGKAAQLRELLGQYLPEEGGSMQAGPNY